MARLCSSMPPCHGESRVTPGELLGSYASLPVEAIKIASKIVRRLVCRRGCRLRLPLPHEGRRLAAIYKHFKQHGTVGKGLRCRYRVAPAFHTHKPHARGDRKVGNGSVLHGLLHKVQPNRRGDLAPSFPVAQWFVIVPSHPDPRHHFWCIAYKPGIVVIVRRTSLARRWTFEHSECPCSPVLDDTLHHTGQEIGHFWTGSLPRVLKALK